MGIIFQTLSQLTNGLVSDATTLVIGILVLGFLAMGFDMLKEQLDLSLQRSKSLKLSSRYEEKANYWYGVKGRLMKGTRGYDEAEMMYQTFLREQIRNRFDAERKR